MKSFCWHKWAWIRPHIRQAVSGPLQLFKSCIWTEHNFLTEFHHWGFHQLDFYSIFLFGAPRYSFLPARQEKAKGSFSKPHWGPLKSGQNNKTLSLRILRLLYTQTLLGQRRRGIVLALKWSPDFSLLHKLNNHRWHILSCLDAFLWIQKINFLNWTKLVFLHSCAFPCCWQWQID